MEPNTLTHPRHRFFSPARIGAIASNTLLELIRQKVFYFLLIFALVLIGSTLFMLDFKIQEQFQMLKDVSLGSMSIFTWLLAILCTAMLLPKDIEDRTLYTILAKPVPRFEYLVGKLLGVLLLLLISTLVMSALFAAVLYGRQQLALAESIRDVGPNITQEQIADLVRQAHAATFTWSLIPGIIAIYLKAALFASLTLLISTFATSWIFTVVISVAVYLIGSVEPYAREYWLAGSAGSTMAKVLLPLVSLLFPDLQLFNLVDDIVAGNSIATALFLKTAALGVTYVSVYFCFAYVMFSRKEL
jgi:ABC-type Na+ efflux pump permease subunit